MECKLCNNKLTHKIETDSKCCKHCLSAIGNWIKDEEDRKVIEKERFYKSYENKNSSI
jgi:hypothetical protein